MRAVVLVAMLFAGCLVQPQSADCTGAADCTACASRSGCGWCVGTRQCVGGTSLGPASGTCAAWRFTSCDSGDPYDCHGNTYCGDCTSNAGHCGWCAAETRCKPANADGTAVDGCAGSFYTTQSTCEAAVCGATTTCGACIAVHAASCYWCVLDNRCATSLLACTRSQYVTHYSGTCR